MGLFAAIDTTNAAMVARATAREALKINRRKLALQWLGAPASEVGELGAVADEVMRHAVAVRDGFAAAPAPPVPIVVRPSVPGADATLWDAIGSEGWHARVVADNARRANLALLGIAASARFEVIPALHEFDADASRAGFGEYPGGVIAAFRPGLAAAELETSAADTTPSIPPPPVVIPPPPVVIPPPPVAIEAPAADPIAATEAKVPGAAPGWATADNPPLGGFAEPTNPRASAWDWPGWDVYDATDNLLMRVKAPDEDEGMIRAHVLLGDVDLFTHPADPTFDEEVSDWGGFTWYGPGRSILAATYPGVELATATPAPPTAEAITPTVEPTATPVPRVIPVAETDRRVVEAKAQKAEGRVDNYDLAFLDPSGSGNHRCFGRIGVAGGIGAARLLSTRLVDSGAWGSPIVAKAARSNTATIAAVGGMRDVEVGGRTYSVAIDPKYLRGELRGDAAPPPEPTVDAAHGGPSIVPEDEAPPVAAEPDPEAARLATARELVRGAPEAFDLTAGMVVATVHGGEPHRITRVVPEMGRNVLETETTGGELQWLTGYNRFGPRYLADRGRDGVDELFVDGPASAEPIIHRHAAEIDERAGVAPAPVADPGQGRYKVLNHQQASPLVFWIEASGLEDAERIMLAARARSKLWAYTAIEPIAPGEWATLPASFRETRVKLPDADDAPARVAVAATKAPDDKRPAVPTAGGTPDPLFPGGRQLGASSAARPGTWRYSVRDAAGDRVARVEARDMKTARAFMLDMMPERFRTAPPTLVILTDAEWDALAGIETWDATRAREPRPVAAVLEEMPAVPKPEAEPRPSVVPVPTAPAEPAEAPGFDVLLWNCGRADPIGRVWSSSPDRSGEMVRSMFPDLVIEPSKAVLVVAMDEPTRRPAGTAEWLPADKVAALATAPTHRMEAPRFDLYAVADSSRSWAGSIEASEARVAVALGEIAHPDLIGELVADRTGAFSIQHGGSARIIHCVAAYLPDGTKVCGDFPGDILAMEPPAIEPGADDAGPTVEYPTDTDGLLALAIWGRDKTKHRWIEYVDEGASDDEIKAWAGRTFDRGEVVTDEGARIRGGSIELGGDAACSFEGGKAPRFWTGRAVPKGKATLYGAELVARIRRELAIPFEDGTPAPAKVRPGRPTKAAGAGSPAA